MNRKEAEAFFDKLEEGLKDNFTIPKRKLSSSPSNKGSKRPLQSEDTKTLLKKSPEKIPFLGEKDGAASGSDGDINTSQETSPKKERKPSAYDRKPPGFNEKYSVTPKGAKRPRVEKPWYEEVNSQGLAGDLTGLHTWASTYDGELPKELLVKCRYARCDLCEVDLSSAIVAKTHYIGKNHSKKTTAFLDEMKAKGYTVPNKLSDVQTINPQSFSQDQDRCQLCNVQFSSAVMALSHYRGKSHNKAVKNRDKINPLPKKGNNDPRGQFGIGMSFYKGNKGSTRKDEERGDKTPEPLEDGELTEDGWSAANNATPAGGEGSRRFYCLPCKIYFGGSAEYSAHIKSGEHKSNAFSQMGERAYYCSVCMVQCDSQETYDAHLKNPRHKTSVASAAAPSLQSMMSEIRADPKSIHFCKVCNMQCTGPESYEQHMNGKNHKKKVVAAGGSVGGGGGSVGVPPVAAVPASQFFCQVCKISTTDKKGLDMHMQGKKHKKEAQKQGQK